MSKLDLKKELKHLYNPSKQEVSVVDVPAFNYIMIDGKGTPLGNDAQRAIEALYPVAYKIKFAMKQKDQDFTVMPLEGLWWADNMDDFITRKKDNWKWTYMIMQPDFVTKQDFNNAVAKAGEKDIPSLAKVRFERFAEGRSAQLMHIGPYDNEGPNIQRIHDHIESIGGKLSGKHHEIYLSDPRRAQLDKMKTILRQPFNY